MTDKRGGLRRGRCSIISWIFPSVPLFFKQEWRQSLIFERCCYNGSCGLKVAAAAIFYIAAAVASVSATVLLKLWLKKGGKRFFLTPDNYNHCFFPDSKSPSAVAFPLSSHPSAAASPPAASPPVRRRPARPPPPDSSVRRPSPSPTPLPGSTLSSPTGWSTASTRWRRGPGQTSRPSWTTTHGQRCGSSTAGGLQAWT